MEPKYIVATVYDEYEHSLWTYVSKREALEKYQEQVQSGYCTYFGTLSRPPLKNRS